MSMCKAASTEQYTSHECRSHMCQCAWRERERERRSIKSAFHLTGLSICSTKNRCFQLSHRRTRGKGGLTKDGHTEEESRYSNEEMVALKSRSGERGNMEGEVRNVTNIWGR